jgi:hypothetical protein
MFLNPNDIDALNANVGLDFFTAYNNDFLDPEINDDPYFGIEIISKFHDFESLSNSEFVTSSPIYVSVNIQSLQSKYEQFVLEILELEKSNIQIDVIAIQEIWDLKHPELFPLPGYKQLIFKQRRGMRGGGVGFYVKNHINTEVLEVLSPFENKIIEALTIRATYPDKKSVLLSCIYRSNGIIPNVTSQQQIDRFMAKFDELLAEIQALNLESYIFIDSNIDLLSLRHPNAANYLNLIIEKSFLQGTIKATRMQNNSKSLIDHILFNKHCNKFCTGTLISDISDHFFTFIVPPDRLKNPSFVHKSVLERNFSAQNLNNFKLDLAGADWTHVLNSREVDDAYDKFWNIYTEYHNTNFPLIRKRFNKNYHRRQNFMTAGLLVSRTSKNNLHKTAITYPTQENIQRYKNFKTLYFRVLRAAKKLYFKTKINENLGNPKKTWDTLNEILGKVKKSETISQLNINDATELDPSKIANHFNAFFTSIGTKIANDIQDVDKQPEDYMNYGRIPPEMQLGNTTPEHVLKIIKKFKIKHSKDIFGISTKMVKLIGPEIANPLSHIFNISLESGTFPNKLKQCRVIPIFKSGNHLDCDNYRPISLLSSISKVLEKIVSEKLLRHLTENDLLYVHQYGFIPKKSAEHNLLHIINYVSAALNDGNFCIGVFLDLKKAFDVCSHSILLKKLSKMGINNTALRWFTNYLSGRSQRVDINGNLSDELGLDISVIQGSILGPILFLCYINDFYTATSLFSVLFADDTTCLSKGKNLNELIIYVNNELQKIANWFRANKMAVNTSKTKFIVFRTRGKVIDPNECRLLFNNNELGKPTDPNLITQIDRIHNEGQEKHFKLLGVLFDEYLSFEAHISHLCTKISKSLFCINRIKNFVNTDSLKQLYYAMIHSHLSYCINVYSCANTTAIQKLRLKQKEAIRVIYLAGYRDHTKPLFQKCKILPLDEMIKFTRLKFMHNYIHSRLPFSFNETWMFNHMRNPERVLRNANNLYVPAHHYATVKRFPLYSFPIAWNEEENRKFNPSHNLYCKQLKESLLSNLAG